MRAIRVILCPVDFSEPSEEAARYAVSLGQRVGATDIHLLHVYQRPMHTMPDGRHLFASREREHELRAHLARELESLAKRYSAHEVAVSTHLVDGVPYEVILGMADELSADLVVLGTHGRSGMRHLLLGSVTERVVRRSHVPVCTVRADRS